VRVSLRPIEPMPIAEFDAADAADAAAELMVCCASKRWVARLVHARPFTTLERLLSESDATLRSLDWADIEEAVDAYRRLGVSTGARRPDNDAVAERQAVRSELGRTVRSRLTAAFV